MAVGGDILEMTYNHPELGSGRFNPKSNEDSTFDPGGYRSNDEANGIAGNGDMIDQMNRVRWSAEATVVWDMNGLNELDIARQLASSPVPAEYTVSLINGTVWKGNGKPVGDLQGNGNTSTFPLKLSGGGLMKKIVG